MLVGHSTRILTGQLDLGIPKHGHVEMYWNDATQVIELVRYDYSHTFVDSFVISPVEFVEGY